MTNNPTEERALFEKWLDSQGLPKKRGSGSLAKEQYLYPHIEAMWDCWQAAIQAKEAIGNAECTKDVPKCTLEPESKLSPDVAQALQSASGDEDIDPTHWQPLPKGPKVRLKYDAVNYINTGSITVKPNGEIELLVPATKESGFTFTNTKSDRGE